MSVVSTQNTNSNTYNSNVDAILSQHIGIKDLRAIVWGYCSSLNAAQQEELSTKILTIFRDTSEDSMESRNARALSLMSGVTIFSFDTIGPHAIQVASLIRTTPSVRGLQFNFRSTDSTQLEGFYESVLKDNHNIESLSIAHPSALELEIATRYCSGLRDLYIEESSSWGAFPVKFSKNSLHSIISKFQCLNKLQVRGIHDTPLSEILKQCKRIEALSIFGRFLTSDCFAHFSPSLRVLDLSFMSLGSAEVTRLSSLKLRALRVQGCFRPYDNETVVFPYLETENDRFIDDPEYAPEWRYRLNLLSNYTHLKARDFQGFSDLVALDISNNPVYKTEIILAGISDPKSGAKQLRQLRMRAQVKAEFFADFASDKIVKAICDLNLLEDLDIVGYEMGVDNFTKLAKMPSLNRLSCGGWKAIESVSLPTSVNVSLPTIIKERIESNLSAKVASFKETIEQLKKEKPNLTITFKPYQLQINVTCNSVTSNDTRTFDPNK